MKKKRKIKSVLGHLQWPWMKDQTMEEIANLFLGEDSLKRTMCTLCNGRDQLCQDPISETLIVMHTSPISPMLTDAGVILFRAHPMMVVPYTSMTEKQLQRLASLVQEFVISRSTSDGAQCFSGEIGNGYIMLSNPIPQEPKFVPLSALIDTFISLMRDSRGYDAWAKRAICSVVLQRLGASIGTSGETLRVASSRIADCFPIKAS